MRNGEDLRRGVPERGKSSTSTAQTRIHTQWKKKTASVYTHTNTGCIIYPCGATPGIQPQHPPVECGRAMLNGFCRGRDLKLSWCSVCSRRPVLGALMDCSQVHFWEILQQWPDYDSVLPGFSGFVWTHGSFFFLYVCETFNMPSHTSTCGAFADISPLSDCFPSSMHTPCRRTVEMVKWCQELNFGHEVQLKFEHPLSLSSTYRKKHFIFWRMKDKYKI